MAVYTWLNESEFKKFSSSTDKEIQEAFKEVNELMPDEWFLSERQEMTNRFLRKSIFKTHYTLYQRTEKGYEEVRIQMSANSKETILNLFYGLIMGFHKAKTNYK